MTNTLDFASVQVSDLDAAESFYGSYKAKTPPFTVDAESNLHRCW